ncbi:DeoR/GlpR family DNA-binding transcription regulator [Luteibacter anthropi]|uniref:DeoR/GlpR family DNA-binding transcription regulator n=1 Tax=Luteibacter anthropi TaxID=564369 RepID=UPI0020325141|nr:DeoR/GlpR family DNA-binding transcription regulator [Luteibacter anthropi]URX62530.1 DeoR/GlpR family DNA-binding transcription regulator [Luteibacter anthropi]
MLTTHRKKAILDLLKRDGQVVATDLSVAFEVSEDTIRRDLRELAAERLLQRVHGGALPASPATAPFAARLGVEAEAKLRIARKAASLISPGQVVIIDGGTTSDLLVRQLPAELAATVVTHSPSVAVALAGHASVEVILLGGRLFKHSIVTVGAAAIEAASHVNADLYFMGVTGVHPTAGFSTGDFEEAHVKRALAARAAETIVLASASKLNAASPYRIGDIGLSQGIIVERGIDKRVGLSLEKAGATLIHA